MWKVVFNQCLAESGRTGEQSLLQSRNTNRSLLQPCSRRNSALIAFPACLQRLSAFERSSVPADLRTLQATYHVVYQYQYTNCFLVISLEINVVEEK